MKPLAPVSLISSLVGLFRHEAPSHRPFFSTFIPCHYISVSAYIATFNDACHYSLL